MTHDWQELHSTAHKVIDQVMLAGAEQRTKAGRDPGMWREYEPRDRLHHAWIHLLQCKTTGNPFLLTEDTCLENIKHAITGLLMIVANAEREEPVIIDTREGEVKGE